MSRTSGSSGGTVTTDKGNKITLPTPAYLAPAGASLGQSVSSGGSLISTGEARAIDTATGTMIGTATGAPLGKPRPDQNMITLGTTINQAAPAGGETGGASSAGSTAKGEGPLKALTGDVQVGPSRSPALSTNFQSIVGGAGNLGRRGSMSKRTLIGGA